MALHADPAVTAAERALIEDLEGLAHMRRYLRWKRDLVAPFLGPRVIEAGCGIGLMLDGLADRERLVGVDVSPGCVARARARLAAHPQVEVLRLDVQDEAFVALADRRPTGVLFANALEYVADDARALAHAARALPPGGRVVVLAWALDTPPAGLAATYGLRGYTPAELGARLAAAGLDPVHLGWVNLLGAMGWWFDRRRVERAAMDPAGFRARDRAVPLARLLDRLTGPPRGRLALGVGQRPGPG